MKKFVLLLCMTAGFSSFGQMSGTYTVGTGGDYSSLPLAFNALNTNGINGDIVLEILDGYSSTGQVYLYNPDPTYNVTVRPESGAASISFDQTSGTHLFYFFTDHDNITVDGADPSTGNKVFTFNNTYDHSNSSAMYIIRADDITIKNCIVKTPQGSGIRTGTLSGSSNILIDDNEFISTATDNAATVRGVNIEWSSVSNLTVQNCRFYMENGSADPNFYSGISSGNLNAYNNVIAISSAGFSGISYSITENCQILNNTVHLYGDNTGLTDPSSVVGITGSKNASASITLDVINNIINISRSYGVTTTKYAFYFYSSWAGQVLTHNNFSVADDGTSTWYFVKNGVNGYNTEAEVLTYLDNSTFGIPLFTDEVAGDLSLMGTSLTSADFRGTPVGLTTDILEVSRSTNAPSKGAYESPNNITDILDFSITNQAGDVVIDDIDHTIQFSLTGGSSTTQTPTIAIMGGATISPLSGVAQDFADPVNYTVTAENGDQQVWEVSYDPPSMETDIITFTLEGETGPATINAADHTVDIVVERDAGTNGYLQTTLTVSEGASVSPTSGSILYGNYNTTKTFTVTAEDGITVQDWEVNVTREPLPGGTYTVGSTGDFATLDDVSEAIEGYGVSGDIVIEILDGHSESSSSIFFIPNDDHNGYALTIQPATGATGIEIGCSSAGTCFQVQGIDNFTFDGGNVITLVNNSSGSLISAYGDNMVFKNLTLNSVSGIASFSNSNGVTIENNTFMFRTTASGNVTLLILYNTVTNATIENNMFIGSQDFSGTNLTAIYIASDNSSIVNNVIHLYPTTASLLRGIAIDGTSNLEISHNTIVSSGNSGANIETVKVIEEQNPTTGDLTINNNIIDVSRVLAATSAVTGLEYVTGTSSKDLEYNNIHIVDNASVTESVINLDNSDYDESTIGNLNIEGLTTESANFVSLFGNDLNLTGTSLSEANLRGKPLLSVTDDIEGNIRSGTAPSKGAYEYDNTIAEITGFTLAEQYADAVIDNQSETVDIEVDAATSLTGLTPTITTFPGSSVTPASGISQDFSSSVDYTVEAEAGNSSIWTVTVTEHNETPTGISLSASVIDENEPVSTSIGTFSTSDVNIVDSHTYALVSGEGDEDNSSFTIDGNILKSNAIFNHETKDSHSIRIETTDIGGETFEKTFVITITDISESPTDITLDNSDVDENQSAGTLIGTLGSTDEDEGENHIYSFVNTGFYPDNEEFIISGNELSTDAIFNHELNSSYSIQIQTDDGNGGSYTKTFTINVGDIPEAPTGIDISGNSIAENQSSGTSIGSLSTTDEDEGESYTYSLVSGEGDDDNAHFAIVGNELQSNSVFDFEAKASFSIRIQTDDGNSGTHEEVLSISVNDANDNPTAIAIDDYFVDENQAINTVVGTISTEDQDSGDSHSYALVSGSGDDDNGSFNIMSNELLTSESFDFEVKNSYSIRLQTDDGNGGVLEEALLIGINDGNDSPSDITLNTTMVDENIPLETVVGSFTAADQDTGESFTYSLVPGTGDDNNDSFTIQSGELRSASEIDYETTSSLSIRIEVEDSQGATYQKSFILSVTDQNDYPILEEQTFEVSEHALTGYEIGTIAVTDPDAGQSHVFDPLTGEIASLFAVSANGVLSVADNQYLNHEDLESVTFDVTVSDVAMGSLSTTAAITVNILDENDEPTDLAVDNLTIDESLPTGSLVGLISSEDEDAADTHTYSLVSGSGDTDNASFQISGNELRSNEVFDFETKTSYDVRIQTDDGNGGSFEKSLTISINDLLAQITAIQLDNASVSENEPGGSLIGAFSTFGEDLSGNFTYSFVTGIGDDDNASFTITNDELQTSESFNFEVRSSYSIRVKTDDGIGNSGEYSLMIDILDVSEAPTNILLSNASVSESVATGTLVGLLSSEDEDANESFSYALVEGEGGDDNSAFQIINNELQTAEIFDYETRSGYTVRIQSNDGNGGTFEKSFAIQINDITPQITDIVISNATVDENASLQTAVGDLSVLGEEVSVEFTFALVNGEGDDDNESFSISDNQLTTNEIFNHEVKSDYSVRISAESGDVDFEKIISILVTDVSEAPTDVQLSNASIHENENAGSVVGTFTPVDEDEGNSFTYMLVTGEGDSGNDAFEISGDQLLTLEVFDYEAQSGYEIRVRVDDGNGGTLEKSFNVGILNKSEAPVNITLSNSTIDENQDSGEIIGLLTTTDQDEGESYTYTLVQGAGSSGNDSFVIDGDKLKSNVSFNFEVQSAFEVRIETNDGNGGQFESTITIQINDLAEAPTGIVLSDNTIEENSASGSLVGLLTAIDEDNDETYTYTLITGEGDNDNSSFEISNDQLLSAETFDFETTDELNIRIQTDDGNGGIFSKAFAISVVDIPESSANDIIKFSFAEQVENGVINSENRHIEITVAHGTDVTNLTPDITISDHAAVTPGAVPTDFSAPVSYTVIAEDGSTAEWIVVVNIQETPLGFDDYMQITIFPNPVINELHINQSEVGSTLHLINSEGRTLRQLPLVNQNRIDVSDLRSGVYIVRIISARQKIIHNSRVIKVK